MTTTSTATESGEQLAELHLHRLLVAIDGSPNAELALTVALNVAQRDRSSLTLVAVAPDVVAESARWPWPAGSPDDMQREADEAMQEILREAVERVPSDIPVTTVMRRGRAGSEIVAEAREGSYDAIMLGARGLGRVGSLLGSVSNEVLHNAETAVFVAHAPKLEEEDSTG